MSRFAHDSEDRPEEKAARLARLQRMTDADLIRDAKAAAFLANRSERWRVKLAEYRAEWRQRHPGTYLRF